MGVASRLSQHHLVSRRRVTRRKPVVRRKLAWNDASGAAPDVAMPTPRRSCLGAC